MATLQEALDAALTHHQNGRLAEAEILYRRILDADPGQAVAHHYLGLLYGASGRHDDARRHFDAAASQQPTNAAHRLMQAKLSASVADWAAAAATVRIGLALNPGSVDLWTLSGNTAHNLGQEDTAITALYRGHLLNPVDKDVGGRLSLLLHARARNRLGNGQPDAARGDATTALRAARASGNVIDPELLFTLGNTYHDIDDFVTAAAVFRQAMAMSPEAASGWSNLGLVLGQNGALNDALACLQWAAHADPTLISPRDHLVTLLEPTAPTAAIPWSRQALTLKLKQAEARQAAGAAPAALTSTQGAAPRGDRQIVAFSLWGQKEVYLQGALANALAYPKLFPGWHCRFYHDGSPPRAVLAQLADLDAELVEMPADSTARFGTFWRFLVADDPQVRRFMVRDCDSRPGAREQAAVAEWLASGLPFHIMRDYVTHTDLILAGMWGGVGGVLPPLQPLIENFAAAGRDRWQDQAFLSEQVWPRIHQLALIHDSVHPDAGRPFPQAPANPVTPHIGAKVLQIALPAENNGPTTDRLSPDAALYDEVDCRHGRMRYLLADRYIGRCLALYHEWSEDENTLCANYLPQGGVVVEAGSNIGSHTVFLGRTVGAEGIVHAFEPQGIVFEVLSANVAGNGLSQVTLHRAAVGATPGTITIPVLDPRCFNNFGGVEAGGLKGEAVPLQTVDELRLARLDLLKADVEGMEASVIRGAVDTIRRCRPAIYMENDRPEKSPELLSLLFSIGYRVWWHIVPLFRHDNFAGNTVNHFPGILSANILALPDDRPPPPGGLLAVTAPDADWKAALWTAKG